MSERIRELGEGADRTAAEAFRSAQMQDYIRVGIPHDDARMMAFQDGKGPDALVAAVANNERRYFQFEIEGKIAAVACLADWLYADQAPYQSKIGSAATKAAHIVNRFIGRSPHHDSHLPVFGVAAIGSMDIEGRLLLDEMVDIATQKKSRSLYAVADKQDDDFIELFRQNGADIVPGTTTQLKVHGVERVYELMRRDLQ